MRIKELKIMTSVKDNISVNSYEDTYTCKEN